MQRRTVLKAAAALPVIGPLVATGRAEAATAEKVIVAAGDMNDLHANRRTGALAAGLKPDIVTTLGDQQYPDGSLADYRALYGRTPWGDLKSITRPVPGHHEYDTPGARGYFSYFGVPSYYHFPIGLGWRGYALNSHVDIAEQARWLSRDLAANRNATGVVATWSDPYKSSGTRHGGSRAMKPLWDALDGFKAIVLSGHEHNYERFTPDGGIRQFVVGTGGIANYPFGKPEAGSQVRINHVPGVLVLRLQSGGSYRFAFTDADGRERDAGHG